MMVGLEENIVRAYIHNQEEEEEEEEEEEDEQYDQIKLVMGCRQGDSWG